MSETIICPKCHAEIPLSEAMTHALREGFQREFEQKRVEMERALAGEREKVEEARRANENARRQLEAEVAARVEGEKARLQAAAREEAAAAAGLELQDLRAQLDEKRKALEEAQRQELALRKRERELEDRSRALDLEMERRLVDERGKIQEAARKQAGEEQQFRLAEKEKLIGDLRSQIETMKQKAEQGSQQLQGEVQELQLEDALRQAFVLDEIAPVPTGARGADLLQRVHGVNGQPCGTIIWESKRTKAWSRGWMDKLKEDQLAQGADLAILVSQALPDGVSTFSLVEGVWVCSFALALPLAAALRQQLVAVSATRRAESGKGEKMEALYQFVCSSAFRQQVQGLSEAFLEMQGDLNRERVAMEKLWKKREKLIQRILNGTAGISGSLEGIVGHLEFPPIQALELDGAEEAGET